MQSKSPVRDSMIESFDWKQERKQRSRRRCVYKLSGQSSTHIRPFGKYTAKGKGEILSEPRILIGSDTRRLHFSGLRNS